MLFFLTEYIFCVWSAPHSKSGLLNQQFSVDLTLGGWYQSEQLNLQPGPVVLLLTHWCSSVRTAWAWPISAGLCVDRSLLLADGLDEPAARASLLYGTGPVAQWFWNGTCCEPQALSWWRPKHWNHEQIHISSGKLHRIQTGGEPVTLSLRGDSCNHCTTVQLWTGFNIQDRIYIRHCSAAEAEASWQNKL